MKTPKVKIATKHEPKPIPTVPLKWGGSGMKKSKGKC